MLEWPEILLILIVLLLLFGAKKLPDTARSLGRSLRIFKSELRADREESHPGPTQTAELPPASGAVPPPTPADANGSGSTPRREPFAGS